MASGRVHARIAWLLFLPLAVAGGYLIVILDAWLGLGWLAGALAGVLITPDIDIEDSTYEERRLYRLARPFGILWQWLWFPYGALMAHRGLSHAYILGTLTRVAYLLYFVAPAVVLLYNALAATCGYPLGQIQAGYSQVQPLFWYGLVGAWCLQDAGHIFTDHHHRQATRLIRRLYTFRRLAWVPVVVIGFLFAYLFLR